MNQSMRRSRARLRTKNTLRSLGAVRGVQWTFSIHSAYLSENKKFSWSVWIGTNDLPCNHPIDLKWQKSTHLIVSYFAGQDSASYYTKEGSHFTNRRQCASYNRTFDCRWRDHDYLGSIVGYPGCWHKSQLWMESRWLDWLQQDLWWW